ncbi:MAG: uncharacterized protein KVP18_000640 [Porospora cf. gigantea A]|uniref:uncharacterized protein n=1 Tax=Porospora cf. gigantea A TaxID=2853593 RepID=UPI0035595886|nr:MAG: hypothetical protein KVP18_000640 [Porospora cf. gigantea A]
MTVYGPITELVQETIADISRVSKNAICEVNKDWRTALARYEYAGESHHNSSFTRCLLELPMIDRELLRLVLQDVFNNFDLRVDSLLWGRILPPGEQRALVNHVPSDMRYQISSLLMHSGPGSMDVVQCRESERVRGLVSRVLHNDSDRMKNKMARNASVITTLKGLLRKLYPFATVSAYGAQSSEFATSFSDYDYTLSGVEVKKGVSKEIHRLAHKLQGHSFVSGVECRTSAAVPLCRLILQHPGNAADDYANTVEISFSNHIALQNSELLYLYATFDSRCAKLGRLVKLFVRSQNIVGAQYRFLSNYAWMTVDPPVLPCLQAPLLEFMPRAERKTNWFYKPSMHRTGEPLATGSHAWSAQTKRLAWQRSFKLPPSNCDGVGLLFWKFCRFYLVEFPWTTFVVDTRTLDSVPKASVPSRKSGIMVCCPIEKNRYLSLRDFQLEQALQKLAEVSYDPNSIVKYVSAAL